MDLLYESYQRLINPSYPGYLRRVGLTQPAIRAEGATIKAADGRTYIDCVGGYGICNLGHNHPALTAALIDQIQQHQLTTRPLITEQHVRLAQALAERTPGDLTCSLVLNSGSEAVDAALKLSRLSSRRKGVITAIGSFHGHTYGALSASGIESFRKPFAPLLPGFTHVHYNDLDGLEHAITGDTGAVLIEAVQHEAGVVVPAADYLAGVRDVCDRHGLLLIVDEIKTGMGKTGKLFACQHSGVVPDILILGKSLGAGLMPVGAIVAKPHLWRRVGLSFPMSASTYAGNVFASRVGLETLRLVSDEAILSHCRQAGKRLLEHMQLLGKQRESVIRHVAGIGMLIGVQCVSSSVALELVRASVTRGVLVAAAFGDSRTVMIEPPLVISDAQIDEVCGVLQDACMAIDGQSEREQT